MHYPVMTERQVAVRWKISLKTLRRSRLDNEGPVWHKLFHHVRYHEEDILEFERQSAQYWMAILGDGERVPRAVTHPPKNADDRQSPEAPEPEVQYVSAKDLVEATGLSTSASEAICATKPVGRFESALFSPENP